MPFDPSTAKLFDPGSATPVEEEAPASTLDYLKGAGEAALNLATGIVGGGLGTLSGTIAGIRQHGMGTQEQLRKVEEEAAKQASELTYQPRTKKGQEYSEIVGKGMEQLIPVLPMAAEFEGGMAANRAAKAFKKEATVSESMGKLGQKGGFDPTTAKPLDEIMKQAETENAPATPFNPNRLAEEVQSPYSPAKNRRQQSLDFGQREMPAAFDKEGNPVLKAGTVEDQLPGVFYGDDVGQIFRGVADDMAYEHAQRTGAEARGELPEQQLKQQGEVLAPTNPYDVGGHVSALERGEPTVLDQAQHEMFGKVEQPGDVAAPLADQMRLADESRFREQAKQGDLPLEIPNVGKASEELGTRGYTGQTDLFAPNTPERVGSQALAQAVEAHPSVKAVDRALSDAQAVLEKLQEAGASADKIVKAQKELSRREVRADEVRQTTANRLSPRFRKQGGGTTTDFLSGGIASLVDGWKKRKAETTVGESQRAPMDKIPGVADKLKDFVPEQRSIDDIRAEAKTRPDVEQNWLQRSINQFTAGGLYQSLKTNNIIIKKTFESVSNAYDRAQSLNRSMVYPLVNSLRELPMKQKGELWAKMMLAEGKETLTAEQLRRDGFNDKQVKAYEQYRQAADYALKAINEARAAAGKKPLDPRLGYVAGVFSGDFRRVLYATVDGKKTVVGVVGSHTRLGLDHLTKKIQEAHPEWEAGEQKYMGGSTRSLGDRQKAFEEALEFLGENDPNVKELVKTYQESMTSDAYNYLNHRKHTKQKRGVEGSEGMKAWQSIEKNALGGMKAQVRYLENSYKWAELSKAAKELQPLLSDPEINMPNAKQWANQYIDRALGISDNDIGKGIDKIMDGIGKATGIGPSVFNELTTGAKNITSKTLLGFVNIPFLTANLIQPIVGTPAIMALLKSRGIHPNLGPLRAMQMFWDAKLGKEPTGFNRSAFDFANEHGILTSDIFDHSLHLQKGPKYYLNKIAELGIGEIEEGTRASVFFSVAHTLKEAGMKVDEGLFETAHKMTNVVMTDYRGFETPRIFGNLGPIGHLAANLSRFKMNQLGATAFYARELARNKSTLPLAVSLATGVASAGVLGMLGFQEMDSLYTAATNAMGKPDTLTRLVLDNSPEIVSHGMLSAATGIDWSSRLGLQDVVPNSLSEAAFPGGSRLTQAAAAVPEMFGSSADRMRGARELVPNSARGLIDRAFFEDEQGRSINPKNLEPLVQRTEADKLSKTIGATGLNESVQKSRLYQQRLLDNQYAKERQAAIKAITDKLYTSGELDRDAMQRYLDAEGDPNTLSNAIVKFKTNSQMTEYQRRLIATSAAGSVNAAKRLQRLQGAGLK